MAVVYSSVGLFFVVLGLILLYNLSIWDSSRFGLVGLRSWFSSFECGFACSSPVESYFSYTYFVLLVFFVVFDLEVSLLLNMPLQGAMFKNFGCYFFFLILISFGFLFEVGKGYVSWGY